ncbi:hypothetical protein ACQ4WP_24295 [Janthinobacterium sp. GB4P2]|uniref:hypothetical protein n=1 Tax=Janthinobacterium sp. GB4P2 TaxID=3424189 RepID=UPI003F1E609F
MAAWLLGTLFLSDAIADTKVKTGSNPKGIAALAIGKDMNVHLDGILEEEVWSRAPSNDHFYLYEPDNGKAAPGSLRTSVQVLVDADALIIGIRAWDRTGDRPQGTLARRDKVGQDQDFIGIFVDPSGHGRDAQFVRINTAGVLSDGLYRGVDDETDLGPDFPIDAAVKKLPDGYSMEVRWPLSSLRFPYSQDRKWRMMIERSVPHANGMMLLSTSLQKNALSYISEMQEILGIEETLSSIRDRSFFTIRPELTTRLIQDDVGLARKKSTVSSIGMEIHARPRADWVINATINPDFSQVEIDEPSAVGASHIAQDLPEKRGFFLESSDVLGVPISAFYSRSVADPSWGLRATWRGTESDATSMSLRDQAGAKVLRGSPYGTDEYQQNNRSRISLARMRWHSENRVNGIFLSERHYGLAGVNRVLGIDGQWSSKTEQGQDQVSWMLMQSTNTAGFNVQQQPIATVQHKGWYGLGKYSHRSLHWANQVTLESIGPNFVNDNGFVPQAGVLKMAADINRRLGSARVGADNFSVELHELEFHLGVRETRTYLDRETQQVANQIVQREIQPGIWLYAPGQTRFWTNLGFDQLRARRHGKLHNTPALHFGGESSPLPWLALITGEITVGKQLDQETDRVGNGGAAQLGVRWRLPMIRGTALEMDHRWNRIWVQGRTDRPAFVDKGWRWLGMLHFSSRDSMRVLMQNTSSSRFKDDISKVDSWQNRQQHQSIMYRHIWQHERSFSIGLSRDIALETSLKTVAATFKFQWML